MTEKEKIIVLINTIEELFNYEDIDEVIMNSFYDNNFIVLSNKLNELFGESINKKALDMISKIDKKELFYLDYIDEFKDNNIRKQIVEYIDNNHLYFNYDLVKKYIKDNYKLAKYLRDKESLLKLVKYNEKVILFIEGKYLNEEFILKQMKKSSFITEVLLGLHGMSNDLYKFSMFYKNNIEINNLLTKQVISYLDLDIYKFIGSSELVKNNIDIVKYVFDKEPKFINYVSDDIRKKISE